MRVGFRGLAILELVLAGVPMGSQPSMHYNTYGRRMVKSKGDLIGDISFQEFFLALQFK